MPAEEAGRFRRRVMRASAQKKLAQQGNIRASIDPVPEADAPMTIMRTYFNAISRLTRNEAAVAAILLATVCTAMVFGSLHHSSVPTGSDSSVRSDARRTDSPDGPSCPECGVVETTRVIEQPGNREVVVHMRDGSTRVFQPETTSRWRARERLIFIEGTKQASK